MSALGWVKIERDLLWAEPLASDLAAFGLYVHIRLVASRGLHHSPQGLVPANSAFLSLNKLAQKCGLSRRTLILKLNVLVESKLIEFSVSKMGALVTLIEGDKAALEHPENSEKGLGHMAQGLGYTAQPLSHMAQGLGYTAQHIQEGKRKEYSSEVLVEVVEKPKRKKSKKHVDGWLDLEAAKARCPLLGIWVGHAKGVLPCFEGVHPERLENAEARWAEKPDADFWIQVIERLKASRFCRGLVPPREGAKKAWVANFDWLVSKQQIAHIVLEGKYDDSPNSSAPLPDLSLPKRDEKLEALEAAKTEAFMAWYAESGYTNIPEALAVYNPQIHKASGRSA